MRPGDFEKDQAKIRESQAGWRPAEMAEFCAEVAEEEGCTCSGSDESGHLNTCPKGIAEMIRLQAGLYAEESK
jgi:hypothetical protein